MQNQGSIGDGEPPWSLLGVGIDALNPVQVSAAGMDTGTLKREFGDKVAFWGAIDTYHVLPFDTSEAVRDEVWRPIEDLAGGEDYVIGSVHIVRGEVPPQNLVALGAKGRCRIMPRRHG